ncbi:MAG TPA: helix-turn-helix domain-containing protein [Streptosporangiaceae bacterium]
MSDPWDAQREALGAFIRSQRKLANLSLRQLAQMTSLSNPYLSQIERGLHQPSVRVLKLISDALDLSAETMLAHAGLVNTSEPGAEPAAPGTEAVISADERLTPDQRAALIAVYRSMLRGGPAAR